MELITLADYWMGRDQLYPLALTPEIVKNAEVTVQRANALLALFFFANPGQHPGRKVNSGWRPPAVNASIPNAAKKSHHLMGRAVDIRDTDNSLDTWLMTPDGQRALQDIGLWLEHPSATPRWCHVQIQPPGSGRRVFYP